MSVIRGGCADQEIAIGDGRLGLLEGLEEQGKVFGDEFVIGVEEDKIPVPGVVQSLVPAGGQTGIDPEAQTSKPVFGIQRLELRNSVWDPSREPSSITSTSAGTPSFRSRSTARNAEAIERGSKISWFQFGIAIVTPA